MSLSSSFQHTVECFVSQHHLLRPDGKYLVALSGGADSVSLLVVMQDMGYTVEACHCNFHLRGDESDRDEMFCEELCRERGIILHRTHFDTHTYSEVHHVSIEMAARELRYHYFAQLLRDIGADGICVAHHRDDSVETMLINLVRGTGIKGLTGIAPRNGDILRPLLCVGRDDILRYLDEKGLSYVTDSTNLVADVVRNKIRLEVMPLLREINPSVSNSMAETALHLQQASDVLNDIVAKSGIVETADDGIVMIDKRQLSRQASVEYVLHECLEPYRFPGAVTKEIAASLDSVGKRWQSDTHQLVVDRDKILVRRTPSHSFRPLRIPEEGTYCYDGDHTLRLRIYDTPSDFRPAKTPWHVTLDADMVVFPLVLRRVERGDRFVPFGMKGSKLLSDFLTDSKCTAFEKDDQLLLEDARHTIVWLAGRRTSQHCAVSEHTSHILDIYLSGTRN